MAAMIETSAQEVIEATEVAGIGDASRGDARPHNANSLGKEKESEAELSRRSEASENGKKKAKEDKPPTKVVIRRLPPSMTRDVFLDQISPVPDHDYFYYVQGDPMAGAVMGFSRAYINFLHQEDLFRFTETYDNYVFVDNKGQEYPAMVEFSLFQRIPKQRTKKKDPFAGSIETTADFVGFKESLEAAAAEAAKPDVNSKQHFFETEVTSSSPLEETTTPLLEFLKQKRADRARIRDERREEKKRKEAERKLKLKATKERKESEEEPKEIKTSPDSSSCPHNSVCSCRNPVPSPSHERNVKFSKSQLKKNDFRPHKAEENRTDGPGFALEDSVKEPTKCGQRQKANGKFKYRSRHFSNNPNILKDDEVGRSNAPAKNPMESTVKAEQQTAFLRQILKLSDACDDRNTSFKSCPKQAVPKHSSRKPPLLPTPGKEPPFGLGRKDFPELTSQTDRYLVSTSKGLENPQNQSRRNQ